MKALTFLVFAFCFVLTSNAKDYSKIDAWAKATPETKTASVTVLVKYLIIPAKNDSEKVRAVFSWITSHIKYDWNAYETGTSHWQEAASILKQRKGVCQNFSDLFTTMCTEAGLEARTISGYAKSNCDNSWMLNGFAGGNHAWNVVKVQGKWQLMDVTWAENVGGEEYFMADPIQFRRDHLPIDPEWQLAKNIMSLEEYEHMPILGDKYFDYAVTKLTPVLSLIKGKKKIVFEFDSPANINLLPVVHNYDYKDKSKPGFTWTKSHAGNHYRLEITFHAEKLYWVDLASQNIFSDKIATYVVDTRSAAVSVR